MKEQNVTSGRRTVRKLYQYSEHRVEVRTAHSLNMRLIIQGILIGSCLFAGVSYWLLFTEQRYHFPASFALTQENIVLQEQIRSTTAVLEVLDSRLLQIYDHDAVLNILLRKRLSPADSVSRARAFSELSYTK